MLPLAEPIGNGRMPVGVSDAIAVHDSATARNVPAVASTTRTRFPGAAAHSHSNARAGSAISISESLTLKATPITAAASTDQRMRPLCQGAPGEPQRGDLQGREHRVHRVAARGQHRHRQYRERERRRQRRREAEWASQGAEQQPAGGHATQRLG